MTRSALIALSILAGCDLETPSDVTGNFEVTYTDSLRVYLNGELVAEVASGEEADIEWNGETFSVAQVCSDEGVTCPGESYWREVAIDQPWGPEHTLLNFVNLDQERGIPGQRMGGVLADDGTFTMLSGLDLGGEGSCVALGVGTVTGQLVDSATAVEAGVIAYEWGAGCTIDGVDLGVSLRLETDYTAARTGDYDVSSVTPEAPIDESGEEIDPEAPAARTAGLSAR
jgi:hypothetical protein